MKWILLLAQLPAEPSSARVALWRLLRTSGAVSVINGVWALPLSEDHANLFARAAAKVREQGGRATTLTADALVEGEDEALIAQSRADRSRDYDEFAERSEAMLAELKMETSRGKFTFAELEENEQDLEKLKGWLGKIEKRDVFPDHRLDQARAQLTSCNDALRVFSARVFDAEEVDGTADAGIGPRCDE